MALNASDRALTASLETAPATLASLAIRPAANARETKLASALNAMTVSC